MSFFEVCFSRFYSYLAGGNEYWPALVTFRGLNGGITTRAYASDMRAWAMKIFKPPFPVRAIAIFVLIRGRKAERFQLVSGKLAEYWFSKG